MSTCSTHTIADPGGLTELEFALYLEGLYQAWIDPPTYPSDRAAFAEWCGDAAATFTEIREWFFRFWEPALNDSDAF
jgi:hypothetical protein